MAERLAGKVALVSGGARGMGASHVQTLVAEGAKVVFGDILDDEGEAVAAEFNPNAARYVHLDVTKPDDWEAAVATAVGEYGGIDVLVNNAGIINVGLLEDYAISEWQRILDVNLTGVFLGIRAVVKPMKEAGRGSIINISSVAGLTAAPNLAAYSETKGAVRLFTKSVAMECAALKDGVRVNSVHPGIIETPIWDSISQGLPGGANRIDLDAITAVSTPLGVKGLPEDIALGVLYLASDDSRYVTGAELVIDGGMTAR